MVGAVLVKGRRVIGTGYNGAPHGIRHCTDHGKCLTASGYRCRRTVHAEVNALLSAGISGTGSGNGELVLYCTLSPCADCLKLCVAAGVSRVVYHTDYKDVIRDAVMEDFGEVIKIEKFTRASSKNTQSKMHPMSFEPILTARLSDGRRKSKPAKSNARRRGSR